MRWACGCSFSSFTQVGTGHVRQIESVQWGQEISKPRAHRSCWKRGLSSFHLNGGSDHLAMYCIIFMDDVTELMFTVNGAHCTKSA